MTDPLAVARYLESLDLYEIWELQYRPRRAPRGLSLAEFFDLTSYQIFRTFFKPKTETPKTDWANDPVALNAYMNQKRAEQGLPPVILPAVLQDVPHAT